MAHAACFSSLLALRRTCAANGIPLRVELGGGEALIGRFRAAALAAFLGSDASHLLFIDADIGFPPEAVFRLLDHRKEVVGGAYARKTLTARGPQPEFILATNATEDGGLQPALEVGTGFLLISRTAARRITDGYPQLRARLGDVKASTAPEAAMVFDSFVDPDTRRYLNDYQAFCRRWRDIGGEVWVDLDVEVTHQAEAQVLLSQAPLGAGSAVAPQEIGST
ncbi:hypothetical protein DJ018_11370 [Phenylobacterium deserti]|uniref:Glycosyl transferase n=2 Tax=Phenylobacterium deserti TaxID=1914756 RepID=A0A328ADP6_9CAUL|nr:hypothetical protein DJ018_11370 [Phenylobacterium deserti]